MIGQRKTFYNQRVLESSLARKEAVDTLVAPRDSDRKIMQPIKIMIGPATRMSKSNKFSQFRWTCTRVIKKKKLRFTPCKTEQSLIGMEFQDKEAQKD